VSRSIPPLAAGKPNPVSDLRQLLGPVPVQCFVDEHWGRYPLHVRHGDADFYEELISLDDVEELLGRAGALPSEHVQTVSRRPGPPDPPPQALSEITQRMLAGDSLRIRRLETLLDPASPAIRLSRAIEMELQHPLGSLTCYASPAHAVGLGPHHDADEIFSLQVSGTKHWSVYGRAEREEPTIYDRAPGAVVQEIELRAGDLLYIPHGWVHDVTSDGPALSLTIVIEPFRAYRVLDLLVECLRADPAMQAALPACAILGQDQPLLLAHDVESVARIVRSALDRLDPGVVADHLAAELLTRMMPNPAGSLSQSLRAIDVGVETCVQRRSDVVCHLGHCGERISLALPGGYRLDMHPRVEQVLRSVIASTQPFTAGGLGTTLSRDAKVALVRRLVACGVLEVVGP
jgi:bifunctional lysine-specific demethylase and histidyl-hydroxylase NO66